ncbi:hypothetical protein OCU04_011074 [Sclerotinia nivalis]|nr:hypothetical protein OCU04_011074 [Sclerotinia nivalis]
MKIAVIFVGKARAIYEMFFDILYKASPYFRNIYDNQPEEDKNLNFYMEEECDVFGNFIHFLTYKSICAPGSPIPETSSLLELYYVAVKFQVNQLQNKIMDLLFITPGTPHEWDIKRLYNKTNASSKLRWFVAVKIACWALCPSLERGIPALKSSSECKLLRVAQEVPEFACDIFRAQLTYHFHQWPKSFSSGSFRTCEFHIHARNDKCPITGARFQISDSFVASRNLEGVLMNSSSGGVLGKRSRKQKYSEGSTKRSAKRNLRTVIIDSEALTVLDDEISETPSMMNEGIALQASSQQIRDRIPKSNNFNSEDDTLKD